MDPLVKIFQAQNGENRLKILRFFLANQKDHYSIDEIEEKTKIKKDKIRKDITFLLNTTFIDKYVDAKGFNLFKFNEDFEYRDSLYDLIFDFQNMDKKILSDKLKKIGRIKLFYYTGLFLGDDSDVDILIVADNMKPKEMNKVLSDISATFANKLKVLIMDIEEYEYRYKMYDRFLRLILEGKKIVVVDRITDQF